MNCLFAASECAPFVKTGGLGDVIGALPKALASLDVRVSVILPKYGDLPQWAVDRLTLVDTITVPVGWRRQYCGIHRFEYEGVTFYFLENDYYFKRHGSYGFYDDGERFAFFSRAVLEALPYLDDIPDVIHCHDWQTGPISALLHAHYKNHPIYKHIKTLFTIHNLQYQGVYPRSVLSELLDLSDLYFTQEGLEFYGQVSFLKAGLAFSDKVTTVSQTYASEIQRPYYGERLEGFLQKRSGDLQGIVNGIDRETYNPETDPHLFTNYKDGDGKQVNKLALQRELGLPEDGEIPVLSMVTRLVDQKGMDLVLRVFHEIMQLNVQVVILGTGDSQYEEALRGLMDQYPNNASFHNYFDEPLSRKIYAGSDLFIMPSKFEPCGIGQLLAFRYGTLPVVRETGGLKDTVEPYNEFTGEGNGFSFTNYNAHDMLYTIERAVWLYRYQPKKWRELVEKAMGLNYSWEVSASVYKHVYEQLSTHEQTV